MQQAHNPFRGKDSVRSDHHCWVPAGCGAAVWAYAYRQMVGEHVDRLGQISDSARRSDAKEQAVAELVQGSAVRADELSVKLWKPLRIDQRHIVGEVELVALLPDEISRKARVQWSLGALAAIGGVRSAFALGRCLAAARQTPLLPTVGQLLLQMSVEAEGRWLAHERRMIGDRPWLEDRAGSVVLKGLATASPWFEFVGAGKRSR